MEKAKLSLPEPIKNLSKHRLNAYLSINKGSKSVKPDSSKRNLLKTTIKSVLKTSFLMNCTESKNNDTSIYKTSLCTPADSTPYLSCISTPKSRSNQRRHYSKITHHRQPQPSILNNKINNFSKQTKKPQQQCIKMKVTINVNKKVTIQRQFNVSQTIHSIKIILLKQLDKIDKINSYYGFVCFFSFYVNIGIDKMLRNSNTVLKQFKQRGVQQLHLKALFAKEEPDYANLSFSDFKLIKYLGSGGFSIVYLARCGIDGSLCALKFIKKSSIVSENKYKMLENQKDILFTIDHHRLVDLYYALQSKNYIIFGLEYCPNGNLYQYIKKYNNVEEHKAKFLFRQILEGLGALHAQKILFRDMKLQNILFDENGNVKITDFGLSKPEINQQDITYSYCGSPQYMAPQMLAKTGHGFQIDFYALGILLYQLLYGRSPFFAKKKQDIFHAIMNSEPQFPPAPIVSKQAKSLIKGLLQKNPKYRIGSLKGAQQIMNHPWLKGYYTTNRQSPFLIKLSDQNIQVSSTQIKRCNNQFEQQFSQILKQKIFFKKSYVNQALASQIQASTIKLNYRKKFSKAPTHLSKTKSKIR